MRTFILSLVLVTWAQAQAQGLESPVKAAPAPAPISARAVNSTGKSLFVIEALLATFTRVATNTNDGTLLLDSVNPASTYFSESPGKIAGHIKSTDLAGPSFYRTAGDPSSWLNNANMALFASKNNGTDLGTTFVFRFNSAPSLSEDGLVWSINVTAIPSNTDSKFSIGAQSFQEKPQTFGPLVTTYAPVSLFVDPWCYEYNIYTGYIYYWYLC